MRDECRTPLSCPVNIKFKIKNNLDDTSLKEYQVMKQKLMIGLTVSQQKNLLFSELLISNSVTRFGDLLDFGQLFKAFGSNYFAKISHILR